MHFNESKMSDVQAMPSPTFLKLILSLKSEFDLKLMHFP